MTGNDELLNEPWQAHHHDVRIRDIRPVSMVLDRGLSKGVDLIHIHRCGVGRSYHTGFKEEPDRANFGKVLGRVEDTLTIAINLDRVCLSRK